MATMAVTEKYGIDRELECASVFRTTDPDHPGAVEQDSRALLERTAALHDRILSALQTRGVPATGFVVCERIGEGAPLLQRWLAAGMTLSGSDMAEDISPLAAGLNWTIAWEPEERNFIGRDALQKERDKGVTQKLVGIVLQDKGILRGHQKVIVENVGEGETTSGSFSPTLKQSIAFARVPKQTGDHCQVEIRGKLLNAKIVKPVFVRDGKPV